MVMTISEIKTAVPNPKSIVEELDKYIIGQEEAKKVLSLMVFHRALSRLQRARAINVTSNLEKANVLLLGPTGSGKTALLRALAEIVDIPITIADLTSVTASGYVGGNVEDALFKHVQTCMHWCDDKARRLMTYDANPYLTRYDLVVDTVENSIVYLDEIDKTSMKDSSSNRDINGDSVQNELLKLLENGTVDISGGGRHSTPCNIRTVDTTNIIFVCGGAFHGLSDIIYNRLNHSAGIGFNATLSLESEDGSAGENLLQQVTTEDLIMYGFKPEFLGRLPLRAALKPLTVDQLCRIITEPNNNLLLQYQEIFKVFGIELIVTELALEEIAKHALELNTGARALRQIFHNALQPDLFHLYDYKTTKIYITKEVVKKRLCK